MLNAIVVSIRFIVLILSVRNSSPWRMPPCANTWPCSNAAFRGQNWTTEIDYFWIGLYMIWQDWKSALMIVQPETVTSWHRKQFRRYWWKFIPI